MQDQLEAIDELLGNESTPEVSSNENEAVLELLQGNDELPEKEATDDTTVDEGESPDNGIDYTLEVPMTNGAKVSGHWPVASQP